MLRCQHLGQVWDPWQGISCVTLNLVLLGLNFLPGQWELWTGATQPPAAMEMETLLGFTPWPR